jgi:RHS repeat-associated protein
MAGTTLDGATYTLDSAGNRTAKSDLYAGVTTNYGYDAIYELLNAAQSGTTTENYTYDPVGNRLTDLGSASWSYNTSNELSSRPSVSYTYDANGNTTTKTDSTGTTTYSWDFENRLSSVTLPGSGGTVSFKYDPFGRRIYKSSSGATSIFTYDGDNLVETVNASGGVVARYTQGASIDQPLAMLRGSTTSYYETDGLGSVSSLTDTTGALAETYTYDSFGNTTNSSGSLTNFFRYTAREFDTETNLYFYRARYYDPQGGRFISEDPIGFDGGPNFYAYVKNSPVGKFDPTGLATCDYFITGGPNGNGWLYCTPDDPRNSPVSFPAASGNNSQPGCKNNPGCSSQSGVGPIPPGGYHFAGTPGSRKHNGTSLVPDNPSAAFFRSGLLTHFCANPFGPSQTKPFCSEGCVTATQDNINSLNNLLTAEPGSTLHVYPGLPLM